MNNDDVISKENFRGKPSLTLGKGQRYIVIY